MTEVTVIGGGIAGLTAAITAAQQGSRVRLLERGRELGGRARTTASPYRANLGPHALYTDGAFWQWLEQQHLLPPAVGRGQERLVYRYHGELTDQFPCAEALRVLTSNPAPIDVSFGSWARSLVGDEAAKALSAFAFIVTYEVDAARLSAAFVQGCIRRTVQPDVARYFIGGWQALISRLTDAVQELGVTIEQRNHVALLPAAPVVVATSMMAASRLLGQSRLQAEGTRVALCDLALTGADHLPSGLLDLDAPLYFARYTAFDETLAPQGDELIQISCGCRDNESYAHVQARIDAVLDSLVPTWRDQVRWSRRTLLKDDTGAVDLPGGDWRDRAAISQGDGIFCAGDYVAKPGLLSEVSFASGLEAGAAAASFSP